MKKTILIIYGVLAVAAVSAQKIITAGSAITETVCALGDCDSIIASDRTSLYPPHIQKLPSIGYRTGISAEGVIALQPSLFIAEKEYVDATVLTQLRNAGVTILELKRVYTYEGTADMIRQIAAALGKAKEGEVLIQKIKGELEEAARLIKKGNRSPRVLCVFNRDKSSLNMGGTNTFSAILPYVGAESAIQGVEGYKPLNTEALMAANPDYLLMFESGVQSLGGIEGVLRIPGVMQTTAGLRKQIIVVEGIKLSNFGPRLGEAVKEVATQLYAQPKP